MSALHRNALLPEEDMCLLCGTAVEPPADYCDECAHKMRLQSILDACGLMGGIRYPYVPRRRA